MARTNKVTALLIVIICIFFNVIVSLLFPIKTICYNRAAYAQEVITVECKETKCTQYNETYVFYITEWKGCSKETQKFVNTTRADQFINSINGTHTECYYTTIRPCSSFDESYRWKEPTVILIFGNLGMLIAVLIIIWADRYRGNSV